MQNNQEHRSQEMEEDEPLPRMYGLKDIEDRLGCSRPTLQRLRKMESFPTPVYLGAGTRHPRYDGAEIKEFISSLRGR